MGKSAKAGPRAASGARAAKQTNAPTTSKYRGVCWNKKNKRWQSSINVYQKYVYLGSFRVEEDAARCYDRAALKTKGMPCKLNFPASDYFDNEAQLLPDDTMDRVLAGAQAAAAKRVLDSLDDDAGGGGTQGHVGLAIAVLKQHLAQQDSNDAPRAAAAVAAAGAAEARPDPLEAGLAAFVAAVAAAEPDDLQRAASPPGGQHMPFAAAAQAEEPRDAAAAELADDVDAGLLGVLQAFDSGTALQQLWALQQQQQQGGGQELPDSDAYMSSVVQQLEAQVLRLQQQQQQAQGAQPGSTQLPVPQAALHRQASLQPAESESTSRPQRQQPQQAAAAAADDLSVPSLQDMLHHEAQRNAAAAATQQQLRQDLQAMASWLLAGTGADAASPAASNHTGLPEAASAMPPAPAAAVSPAPPAASAIAAAAAAAGMADSTPVFEAAYQATMCDSLAGVDSICSLVAGGAVVCSDGQMRCINLDYMLQQLPPQSRLHHVITHINGLLGVVYQRPCNALRSGLLWGAAMWDGETLHQGSLYSSRADAVRVCCFVLNVVAGSSQQAEAEEAA